MIKILDIKSPRKATTLGMALIAVLVTLQFAGTRMVTERQEIAAIEINLAGRQRMLSQRIARTIDRLAALPPQAVKQEAPALRYLLAACADLMERSHLALAARDLTELREVQAAGTACLAPELDLAPPDLTQRQKVEAPASLAAFTEEAWQIATGALQVWEIDLTRSVTEAELDALLAQLDEATLAAQEKSTAQLQAFLGLNWCMILLLVAGEILLIFRPMTKAVERSIARLRRANQQLVDSETRLQGFAATAAHRFFEIDAAHRLTWIGQAQRSHRADNISLELGRRLWELDGVAEEAEGVDWAGFEATLNAGKTFRDFEFPLQTPSGGRVWWRAHGHPVKDDEGNVTGYRGTLLEVTKEHEEALKLRFSERMQAVGQLTAGVAHDFNNILAVIQGNTEFMRLTQEEPVRMRALKDISDAVSRASSLTSRLLSFGRVQRLRAEPVDVKQFLEELEVLLRRTLGEDFEVMAVPPLRPIAVLSDPHQLMDACLNLALNARDASVPGGRLAIDVGTTRLDVPVPSLNMASTKNEFVRLSFRDNGKGIPENAQQRIFEPFFTTKPVGEGSGLGLSMVYGFALQSQGFVEVESTPGMGTTVNLVLPRADGEAPEKEEEKLGVTPSLSGKSALLVEDNLPLQKLTAARLAAMGFDVVVAANGADALAYVDENGPFDLMVLDIVLPGGLDGIDVAERALRRAPDAAVLFCSGRILTRNEQDAVADLPGPLLTKPFTGRELAEAILGLFREQVRDLSEPS